MLNTSLLYTSLLNASLLNTIARCRIIAVPALQDAGDWMTAFRSAIDIFEGRAVALTGLPCRDDELSNELSALLTSYAEQVFSYLTSAESHAGGPNGDRVLRPSSEAGAAVWHCAATIPGPQANG